MVRILSLCLLASGIFGCAGAAVDTPVAPSRQKVAPLPAETLVKPPPAVPTAGEGEAVPSPVKSPAETGPVDSPTGPEAQTATSPEVPSSQPPEPEVATANEELEAVAPPKRPMPVGGVERQPEPAPMPPVAKEPPQEKLLVYRVKEGETLWNIAARREVYGDALLWPLIYQANRDQIKDPRQIYPRQLLSVPQQLSEEEMEEARQKARQSEIFPLDMLSTGK